MNKEIKNKCKDCKCFRRENIRASRSGHCINKVWIESDFVKEFGNPLKGCGTIACENFEAKKK